MKRKKTYTLLLIFGTLCSLFLGCNKEHPTVKAREIIFINQTKQTIKLEKYFTFNELPKRDVYTLSSDEKLRFKVVFDDKCYVNDNPYHNSYVYECQLEVSDSVVVTFNDLKKLVFKFDAEDLKDIYDVNNYEVYDDEKTTIYTFKFTEAHYLQAK